MMKTELSERLKLAAIDLDGTLLGPDGRIGEANFCAIERLQDAGLQVVLASGRHYHNMRRYADLLPDMQWLVSCQGGELSDIQRKTVLHREFLPKIEVQKVLELGCSLNFTPVIYGVDGVLTISDYNAGLDFYTDLAGTAPRQARLSELFEQPIFKVIWIGEPFKMDQVAPQLADMSGTIQPMRTHKQLWEFMPVAVSKASALKVLAHRLRINSTEVVTFGDGDNDVPMFQWAGASVAMPHGWPSAIRAARYTAPQGPADSALARGVDMLFDSEYFNAVKETVSGSGIPSALSVEC